MPTRSRNPAGYVRKHPDTATLRWQGIVQYPDPDRPGRWKQRSTTFARRAEAQQWVDQTLAEHRKIPSYRPPTDIRPDNIGAARHREGHGEEMHA